MFSAFSAQPCLPSCRAVAGTFFRKKYPKTLDYALCYERKCFYSLHLYRKVLMSKKRLTSVCAWAGLNGTAVILIIHIEHLNTLVISFYIQNSRYLTTNKLFGNLILQSW